MSKYRVLNASLIGVQHIDQCTAPDATSRLPHSGGVIPAVDPYWDGGEFIYAFFTAAVRAKGLVQFAPAFDATNKRWRFEAAELANTANLGRPVGVAVMPAAANTYGWVQVTGLTPVNSNAAVAASTAIGVAATGQAGANSAGKQILNALTSATATSSALTVVKASISSAYQAGMTGSTLIAVTNTDGWFVGGYVSGTGIAAGATVVAIDTAEQIVTLSAVNTAAVTGDITFTYNNGTVYFNVIVLDRPLLQGAIT